MPPFLNIPFLSFVVLVPAILALRLYRNQNNTLLLVVFYGLIYTSVAYIWYVDVFSSIWGYILIVAVAFWHSRLISGGVKLEDKVSSKISIFILPFTYATLEFVQRNIPYVKDWWFIAFPKTAWGFPESLWLLSITGITGVTFIMMLSNSTIAKIIQNKIEGKKNSKIVFINIGLIVLYVAFGFYYINNNNCTDSYNIAVISDMANDISGQTNEGLYVNDEKIIDVILQKNFKLSKEVVDKSDFIVWSENEFFNFNNKNILDKLKKFANQNDNFLVVDAYIKNNNLLYDSAVLITPNNEVGGFSKKTYLFNDEIKAGFVPNNDEISTYMADTVRVGLGVCYDFHYVDIVKKLSNKDAKLILMTRDDDMYRNKFFPYYHSTDAVFRAIENNVAIASANTNGASIVVNTNGKITAYSPINQVSADIGRICISKHRTIYTKYGDWFAYLLIIILVIIIIIKVKDSRVATVEKALKQVKIQ